MEVVLMDIRESFLEFISGLNWTFIFMYSFVIYGINNEPEFDWFNDLMKGSKLRIWVAGFITMGLFCTFKYLDSESVFNSEYVSSLLRSFMVTIILSRFITKAINGYIDKKFKDKL